MAAWTKRVLVGVVLVAMVASLGPPANAQTPSSTAEEPASPPEAEVFVPGAINRTPEGGPIPDDAAQDTDPRPGGALAPGTEVVERRTEDSTTVVAEDGSFETTFHEAPIRFRDVDGAWQPIDNTLVPAGPEGGVGPGDTVPGNAVPGEVGALRNAAGPVALSLPAVLGTERSR